MILSTPNSLLISLNADCRAVSVFETMSDLGCSVDGFETGFRTLVNALFECSQKILVCSIIIFVI